MHHEEKNEKCSSCDGGGCCSSQKEAEPKTGRRTFLGILVGAINVGLLAVIGGPVVGFLGSPLARKSKKEWIPIAHLAEIPQAGAVEITYSHKIQDGYHTVDRQYSVYLRRDGDKVICLDPACTHLGCRVNYQPERDRFLCPCHGGVFDKSGGVVSGPPPKELVRHDVKVEADRVWLMKEV